MVHPFGMRSPRDLYDKLLVDAAKLKGMHPHDVFNFFVTAYHMLDWIKEGPAKESPAIAEDLEATLRNNTFVRVCRDFANASKHFRATRYSSKHPPAVLSAVSARSDTTGAITYTRILPTGEMVSKSFDEYGGLIIGTDDGYYTLSEIRDGLLALYAAFFQKHGL